MASDISGIGKVAESVELGTREVRELLSLFLKPSITQLGLFGGDWLKSQRETQLAKTLAKAKAKLNAGELTINPVPLKLLKPIVEDCSLEEDEDMIERWANLLAAAACGDPVLPTYVRLLAELTPNEARLLDALQLLQQEPANPRRGQFGGIPLGKVRAKTDLNPVEFRRIIINLIHLGLVFRILGTMTLLPSTIPKPFTDEDPIGMTLAANDFLTVCSRPPAAAQNLGDAQKPGLHGDYQGC